MEGCTRAGGLACAKATAPTPGDTVASCAGLGLVMGAGGGRAVPSEGHSVEELRIRYLALAGLC